MSVKKIYFLSLLTKQDKNSQEYKKKDDSLI